MSTSPTNTHSKIKTITPNPNPNPNRQTSRTVNTSITLMNIGRDNPAAPLTARKDEVLFARSRHFVIGVYSILAGFAEPSVSARTAGYDRMGSGSASCPAVIASGAVDCLGCDRWACHHKVEHWSDQCCRVESTGDISTIEAIGFVRLIYVFCLTFS
jgi:hypothetical protein